MTTSGTAWGRLDDLVAGSAVAFPSVRRALVAVEQADVVAVLAGVDALTRAGEWAFGFVAYEAGRDACLRLTVDRLGSTTLTVRDLPPPVTGPVDSRTPWPHHDTSLREPYDRRRARHDADDVLLANERGEITGSCIANVAVRLAGRWWTPRSATVVCPVSGGRCCWPTARSPSA